MRRESGLITRLSKQSPSVATWGACRGLGAAMALCALQLPQALAADASAPATAAYVQLQDDGSALLTAQLDATAGNAAQKEVILTQTLSGVSTTYQMRDDGLDGDEKARDGVYTALIKFDFDEMIAQYRRYEEFLAKYGKHAVPLRFEGRVVVGQRDIMPLEELTLSLKEGRPVPLFPFGIALAINPENSLLVRHPAVVEDPQRTFNVCTGAGNPNGVWTFKHLVTQMSNTRRTGITPETFTRMWLSTWEAQQSVNNWSVPARLSGIRSLIIDPWEKASGGKGATLDLDRAPFQLLAIVNRVDLRSNGTYGNGDAGEGRFVFQVMDENCRPTQFTVIFEYGVPLQGCFPVKSWGKRWASLSGLEIGSPAYNTALETITETFVRANAAPDKPNGSALNQLRTNEIALGRPWELREFVIADAGWNQHMLKPNTVALTPDTSLNNSARLLDYANSFRNDVPLRFPTPADPPFRGGASLNPSPFFHWDEPNILPRQRRFDISINTCNGCHAGETATTFTHIKPGPIPASLSGFLTGIKVPDPADGTPTRIFNDLARRRADLDALVHSSCLIDLVRPPVRAAH